MRKGTFNVTDKSLLPIAEFEWIGEPRVFYTIGLPNFKGTLVVGEHHEFVLNWLNRSINNRKLDDYMKLKDSPVKVLELENPELLKGILLFIKDNELNPKITIRNIRGLKFKIVRTYIKLKNEELDIKSAIAKKEIVRKFRIGMNGAFEIVKTKKKFNWNKIEPVGIIMDNNNSTIRKIYAIV